MSGGIPPKTPEQRRRRNATVPMVQLPLGGRKGAAPPWPYPDQDGAEAELWADLWHLPQAAAWERLGYHRLVARLVRLLPATETGKFHAQVFAEVRQLEDRLGLNPVAMLKLRWEVPADEVAERRAVRPARSRPQAVDPSAVAGSG